MTRIEALQKSLEQEKNNTMNRIIPYKNREIDYTSPVYIYRNLNSRKLSYSIRQKGLVVAHTNAIALTDVGFVVNQAGKRRALAEKTRNVHAFVAGIIAHDGVMGTDAIREEKINLKHKLPLPVQVKYNPFLNLGFYTEDAKKKKIPVTSAGAVIINCKGVFAAYVPR